MKTKLYLLLLAAALLAVCAFSQTREFIYAGGAADGSGLTNLNLTNVNASGLSLFGVTTNGNTGGSNWVGGIQLWNPTTGNTIGLTNGNVTASGTFTGNGSGLTNLLKAARNYGGFLNGVSIATTQRYLTPWFNGLSSTEANARAYIGPESYTITNAILYFVGGASAGTNVTVAFYTNGVATQFSFTITQPQTTTAYSNTTLSATLPAWAGLSVGLLGNNASTYSPAISMSFQLVPQ